MRSDSAQLSHDSAFVGFPQASKIRGRFQRVVKLGLLLGRLLTHHPVPMAFPEKIKLGSQNSKYQNKTKIKNQIMKRILFFLSFLMVKFSLVAASTPFLLDGGHSLDIQFKSTVLTDAQIKALPTAAVDVLVPPPGNSFLVLHRIIVAPHEGNIDYGNFDVQPVLLFSYGGMNSNRSVLMHQVGPATVPNDILDFTGDRIWEFFPGSYHPYVNDGLIFPILTPPREHLPLSVWMLNGSNGSLTGGNSHNSMTITVFYSILPAP